MIPIAERVALHNRVQNGRLLLAHVSLFCYACSRSTDAVESFPKEILVTAAQYAAASRVDATVDRVICTDTGPHACPLNRETGIAVEADGRLLLTTPTGQLLELDSGGRALNTFRSERAAQQLHAAGVTVDTRNRVWILDQAPLRWVAIGRSGSMETQYMVPRNADLAAFAVRRGRLIRLLIPPGASIGANVVAEFRVLDTAGSERSLARMAVPATRDERSADLTPLTPRFAARPAWDVLPEGDLVYSDGASYRVRRYAPDGAPTLLVTVRVAPSRPVTRRDIDSLGQLGVPVGDTMAGSTPGAPGGSPLTPVRGIANRHPAITALRVLADSTIAIRGVAPEAGDSVDWDLWSITGELRGRTRLAAADELIDGTLVRVLVVSRPSNAARRLAWVRLLQSPEHTNNTSPTTP